MPTRKWGTEILVSTTLTGNQYASKTTALAGGGFVVVWQDDSTGNFAVRGQIFDSTGNAVGGEIGLADFAGFNYAEPDVTALADGSFYVTATELGGAANNIVGSVWDANGALIRSQHVTFAVDQVSDSDAASLGSGSVVTWVDPIALGYKINFRIFDASGTGGNILIANPGSNDVVLAPDAAASPGADAIALVWLTNGAFIEGRLFDAAGAPITAEFRVAVGNLSFAPAVTWLNNGEFAVTWQQGGDIYVELFDYQGANATARTSAIPVNSTNFLSQQSPQITALPNGGFVVSWEDFSQTGGDGSGAAIRLQAFDGAGGKIGGEFLVNTTTAFDQSAPSIAVLADGRVVVSWTDMSDADIHMQIIDPRDGIVTGTPGGDMLYGNASVNDEISGFDGDDILIGMNGDDQLYGGQGNDTLNGGRGDDTGYGGAGNDVMLGSSGDDDLFGEDGNDQFRGGLGADAMDGGAGRDIASYILANSAVVAALDGTLAGSGEAEGDTFIRIEDLTGSNIVAEGDTLHGNAAANVLSGLAGNDTLLGGSGNDVLNGGRGTDTLSGEGGNDKFSYASLLDVGDIITDFSPSAAGNNDTIQFKGSVFGGLTAGTILASQFQTSTSAVALTANVRFFYETDTGILRFDADGQNGAAAVIVATLDTGLVMTSADITIF